MLWMHALSKLLKLVLVDLLADQIDLALDVLTGLFFLFLLLLLYLSTDC